MDDATAGIKLLTGHAGVMSVDIAATIFHPERFGAAHSKLVGAKGIAETVVDELMFEVAAFR